MRPAYGGAVRRRTAIRPGATVLTGVRPLVAWVAVAVLAVACVPGRPTPAAEPAASPTDATPTGWTSHPLGDSTISLALPAGWLVLDEAALADDSQRAELEAGFAGASVLFGQLDAQGRRARLLLLGVDPRARDTGRFPPVVTVVAVEPAVPVLFLGLGADFAVDAFERTFELESEVTRADLVTPFGAAIRLGFDHRLAAPGGDAGFRVEHDGAIVTTGDATFLISRNVDPETAPADTPTLDEILATLFRDD